GVAAGAKETSGGPCAGGKRGVAFALTLQARRVREEFVLVGAVREGVAGAGLGEDVRDRVGARFAQVAERGDGEDGGADGPVTDHQSAQRTQVGPGHGKAGSSE